MTPDRRQPYKMSFSTGGLFLNESLVVAGLHVPGEPWSTTLDRALSEGAASLPKAASQRRTLREICNRLAALTQEVAELELELAGQTLKPQALPDGRFAVTLARPPGTGVHAVTVSVSAGDAADLLAAELDVHADPGEAARAARLLAPLVPAGAAVTTPTQAVEQYRAAHRSFDRVVLLVSVLTAASAAFGVTNLLRASVRARSLEIGLRRAAGARREDVRLQFLAEGLLLGLGGGLLGILLGVVLSLSLLSRAGWTPHFAPGTLLLLAGGSAAFGIAAGIRPANEAAALDPAATLRLE
jgi:hypothetical protein